MSNFATSSAVSSDGTTITFRTAGDVTARPLVLVHGWAQSSASWGPDLLTELARSFRVVAVDLRGHGLSDTAEQGYDDPRQWADDLDAVLAAAGIADGAGVLLLGWSYGGVVVSDYLAHRGEGVLGGLVLVGAVTGVSRSAGAAGGPEMRTALTQGALDTDPATAVPALAAFGEAMFHTADSVGAQRLLGVALSTPPRVRGALFGRKVDNDETLSRLTIPALVIHGAHDRVVPPETGRANAGTIPGSTYSEFAHSAHVPFLEQPADFVETLAEFAATL